ncbi:L-Ala-D/L-amino acid epimerase-like [Telopea speciosissima]|uniref:L-Ala-D/L-amino acid epimerase-like n=1 Tax=Telopea speciosissima TaxID=54955 RepID=UPI001CC76F37|nr:L-Ala-D/L-amino acid epimerase-like [Telopea speciosissima]
MDPIGTALHSPTLPIFFSSLPLHTIPRGLSHPKSKILCSSKTMAVASAPTNATTTSFGFKNLETFTVNIHTAEGRPLNVPLIAPFLIANSKLDKVENMAIRVELSNGCSGWGEAPIRPFVTAEDQSTALVKVGEVCEFLNRSPPMTLNSALRKIGALLFGHDFASVRAGVEMALIDAVTNSIGIPLWRLFGRASNTISTDITIPIVSPTEASKLASHYQKHGFSTLKLKVGKNFHADIEALKAIRMVHPDCLFILDANEGYTSKEAIEVLEKITW